MAPLVVRVPSALRAVSPQLAERFGQRYPGVDVVVLPPSPSGMLAQAVLEGEPADVIVSASRAYLILLAEVGFADPPVTIAGNRLVGIVHPRLEDRPEGLAGMLRPGLRLVLSQPVTDPCGQYTREAFERAGLLAQLREKGQRGELAFHRGSLGLIEAVASGEADGAVLYASEAAHSGLVTVPLEPPVDLADRIAFCAAVLTRAREREVAEAFVSFLLDREGQMLLGQAGFIPVVREEPGSDGRSD
ncbi:Molybdate-binding protein [bacterium HR27]|nr:Molybdate-binding protein [bacterium HR27]